MLHTMGLYEEAFKSIKNGRKTVEVRLNDEKRRKIKIGDKIKLSKVPEENEILTVKVIGLREYPTFREMYEDIPFGNFDCDGWTMKDMVEGTYEVYTPEQEERWGTLAITIELVGKFKNENCIRNNIQ